MSGIALEFRRDGAPAEASVCWRMLDRLGHRGPDGEHLVVEGSVTVGCQHFWTTPEEVGDNQPLTDTDSGVTLCLDGRLDNRDELLAGLGRNDAAGRSLSDASLLLTLYDRWGEDCFERLLGPFAIVVWDAPKRRVVLARDPLGDRTLVYRLDRGRLLVASEEQALLAHPEVSSRMNEDRIAQYFAIEVPDDGSTFFAEISELQPGHLLSVGTREERRWQYTRVVPEAGVENLSDFDCAERYLELLTAAVRSRLRSTTPPAVMMSGGLDSTSIAALGARELRAAGSPWRMRAVSWVFDELQECDERRYIDSVLASCDVEGLQFRGDDMWPLRDHEQLVPNPGTPEANPYRELKQHGYDLAARMGSRVVLHGASADVLYSGVGAWMMELLLEGRIAEAARSLTIDVRKRGLVPALRMAGAGALIRPIRAHLAPPAPSRPWLTPAAREHLRCHSKQSFRHDIYRRPGQAAVVLGPREARSVSLEIFNANRAGIDLRHPYRDRRLIEFMLAVPSHQLYRRGRYKHVARVAATDFLPPEIPARELPTLLTPLFNRGLRERGAMRAHELLGSPGAMWPRWVDRDWLSDVVRDGPRREIDDVVWWQCAAFELWRVRHWKTSNVTTWDASSTAMREKIA